MIFFKPETSLDLHTAMNAEIPVEISVCKGVAVCRGVINFVTAMNDGSDLHWVTVKPLLPERGQHTAEPVIVFFKEGKGFVSFLRRSCDLH